MSKMFYLYVQRTIEEVYCVVADSDEDAQEHYSSSFALRGQEPVDSIESDFEVMYAEEATDL